ncbi:MAG: hypothetical protein KKD21_10200 [Proteobacteria bacterium]|nr:hypothetical protein [Pseudomonadota bacterium]MBU1697396.1 hypothetical protein [Pseudomonadota bacterium]
MMRIIGSGHEIPWPLPLADEDFVFPKDYRMNEFPKTSHGQPWFDILDEECFS